MRKAIVSLALVLTVAGAAWAQSSGGAFVPTFNYVVTGQWTWARLTPWIVKASTTAASAYSLVFTTPTTNRTITFPNDSGTVQLAGDNVVKQDQHTVTMTGPNPVNFTTSLASISGCEVTIIGGNSPGIDPVLVTFVATAGQSVVSLYAWKNSSSSVTTLVASSTSGRQVSLLCSGS